MFTESPLQLLSIVIPARDEEGCIASTIEHLHLELSLRGILHEIIVVDDGSKDQTWTILQEAAGRLNGTGGKNGGAKENAGGKHRGGGSGDSQFTIDDEVREVLRPIQNKDLHGFGRAVTKGLDAMRGDAVVIMMADESDDCRDVVRYWEHLKQGYGCVFGSRFMKGGGTIDYPPIKLFLNRMANTIVRYMFRHGLNDTTNAFKAYRREVVEGIRPILSPHFNITVELPLKAVVRGYSFTVIPITWRNRRTGVAKLKIREMGSRYLFIVLYVWLEKYFSCGDYSTRTS